MLEKTITFLGCGSWGAALGAILAEKGFLVRYWHRNKSAIEEMQISKKHYILSNVHFNVNVSFFSEIDVALKNANYIVLAVPSQNVRKIMIQARKHIERSAIILTLPKELKMNHSR